MRSLSVYVLIVVVLAAFRPAEASGQVAKLYPVDEAGQQPEFYLFRARLLRAAQAQDTAYLYRILAPDVLNSFGGDGGVSEFKEMWEPHTPGSEIWAVLTDVLSLGGAFRSDTMFTAPYTSSNFPHSFDAFDHLVVLGAGVRVREGPTVASSILAVLSFDVVARAQDHADIEAEVNWRALKLADGRTGFISNNYVRSPIGYRAVFVLRAGDWLLHSLVAGD